jgi:hypothetical protein
MSAVTEVTPERFAQGITYTEHVTRAKVNQDRFNQMYETAALSAEDAAFFSKAVQQGAPKVLIISEDW